MANPSRDGAAFDAEQAGRREFTKARKGYDPVEVRAHLLSLAAEIKRLQSAEADLVRKVATLEQTVADHRSLDPGAVTRALGDETVRVIDAARDAAAEIRSKAEENAARLVADAHERANRLTQEATDLRDLAAAAAEELALASRAEADQLVADARAESSSMLEAARTDADAWRSAADEVLQARTAEAVAAADDIRRSADEEASEVRLAAAEAAEAEIEGAREQGREMIREAREARERILADLAERRQVGRRQLEALRAGRERLLESFAAARTALDDATDEVVDALPAARDAADQAARGLEFDIDAAIEELDRDASPDGEGYLGVDASTDGTGGASPEPAEPTEASASDAPAEHPSSEPVLDEPAPTERAADDSLTVSEDQEPPVAEPAVVDAEAAAETTSADGAAAGHLRLVGAPGGIEDADTVDELAVSADDGSGGASDGASAPVEAIFAKLRAAEAPAASIDHDDDDLLEGDDDEDDDDDDERPGQLASITAISDDIVVPEANDDGELSLQDAQDVLDVRDEVLGETERAIARRLKRVVGDHENAVLDRVRRQRKATTVDELLGSGAEMASSFVAALTADLVEAIESGRVFVDRRVGTSVVHDVARSASGLESQIAEWVSDPLRVRLARIIEDSDDHSPERTDLVDQLRSAYREWRNEKLSELGGDLVTLAFNVGVKNAMPAEASVCWLVDHGGLPCPDAEDNQLAGCLMVGTEFPTGDVAPPAHPGCRCVLSPVRR